MTPGSEMKPMLWWWRLHSPLPRSRYRTVLYMQQYARFISVVIREGLDHIIN